MVETATCPTKEELIRLTRGDLPGDQLESVCDHVEVCEDCQHALSLLDDPPNEFAKQIARVSPEDLENARIAIEAETLKETATSIWGFFSPVLEPKNRQLTLTVPCQLGQYEVLRLIAHGGMGEVYEGRHVRLKRPVAVKVIRGFRQDDPVSHEHFLREMETAGQLEHPNLVRAYDAWEHDGYLFLAQELLDGDSLQSLAHKGQIKSPDEIVAALLGTCRALEQLHGKGFIHRDVKPANIMRLTDGTIKLIDYGLAIAAETGKSASRVGAGTVGYMSPEQATGSEIVDNRSDIYSAGRVLKYLLIKLPESFTDARQVELVQKLTELAERLTQREPKNRLQSVYAVIVHLEQLEHPTGPTVTPPEPPPRPPEPPVIRTVHKRKASAPKRTAPVAERKSKRHGGVWFALITLLLAAVGFTFFQIVFKTDRQTTVVVQNHKPGDIIELTSEDGKVRSVELGDSPRFVVGRGTYELSLEGPDTRQLNPANITVTGRDQLTVRIEDHPLENNPAEPKVTDSVAESPVAKPKKAEPAVMPPSVGESISQTPFELKMVEIPVGRFEMGGVEHDPKIRKNELPRRSIEFTEPFRMSAHEITVEQFREFVEATDYVTDAEASGEGGWQATRASTFGFQNPDFNWANPGYAVSNSLPVTIVSYRDAVAFCEWLSKRDGRLYRLPTEAEWEYACRAGSTGPYHFPFASRDAYCWSLWNIEGSVQPRPVGTRQPNAWGLYDMSGNVREWCLDWYSADAYKLAFDELPAGPLDGTMRVIRGGCFIDMDAFLRSSHRGKVDPKQAFNNQGFRVVEGAPPVPKRTSIENSPPMSGNKINVEPTGPNLDEPKATTNLLSAPFSAAKIRATRKAWSEHLGLSEALTVRMPSNPTFQIEFALIPPGTFEQGMPASLSPMPGNKPEWAASSRPAHQVTITEPFYLSRYEITQKQFRDVVGGSLSPMTGDGTRFPATQIPWQACVDFCDRVNRSGINIPDGGKLRLPTEAEWEYACRAGTATRFWSGDQIGPNQASIRISGRKLNLEPVDAFQPNPFGLYQMHGNVAEWCLDWFSPDSYASAGTVDPKGPTTGTRKVIRGGGYSNPPFSATSYWRQSYEPTTRSSTIGMRPVLELPSR